MRTPPPSWEDLAWLREAWGGPFMLKGVHRSTTPASAVDVGADAISVSNHGGNNLDGTPATIRALPAIAEAVGGQIEVLLDGGVRRGSDVVKALALGARAVMIGRAYLWGLGRQRAGRRRERAGHPARRHRLGAARPRPRPRSHELVPDDVARPRRLRRRVRRSQPAAPRLDATSAWPEAEPRSAGRGVARCVVPLGRHRAARAAPAARRPTPTSPSPSARGWPRDAPDVVVAPPLAYGASGEHAGFPGTLSIGAEATELVLVELCRSATDDLRPRPASSTAHGGNAEPSRRAVGRLRAEGRDVRAWGPRWGGDAHAGETETSVMLALDPSRVRRRSAPSRATPSRSTS